jgi:hypothetical protein
MPCIRNTKQENNDISRVWTDRLKLQGCQLIEAAGGKAAEDLKHLSRAAKRVTQRKKVFQLTILPLLIIDTIVSEFTLEGGGFADVIWSSSKRRARLKSRPD